MAELIDRSTRALLDRLRVEESAVRPKTHRAWGVATTPKHTRAQRKVRNWIAGASRKRNRNRE